MADSAPYRQIGIVGTGRVARAIGLALAPHSAAPARIWGRNPDHAADAVAIIGHGCAARNLADIGRTCDLIVIAVSDDAMGRVIGDLATLDGPASPFAFHVSGGSGAALLAPLQDRGWLTAAIHPAMTFTGDPQAEVARMTGARFAVTGSTQQASVAARAVVTRLGGVAVDVAEAHRPLYHAALCHGSNHLVTLIADACEALAAAGVDDPAALIAPLARAALDNSLASGMAGLSGPLLRGDEGTIAGHVAAMRQDCPPLLAPYRAMARATLDALERADGTARPDCLRAMLDQTPSSGIC
ncbi:DUF2520 domain-containing protein [Sphingobium sp. HBC34]|uniref:DUF2520 domain-containing protein n=1 Tax=Sphingobium cyanobacteriorum TaxID=3063954 RepID=A0ABT8ZLQ6_9SPHN|nr:DUF2520 domain-containing protein [Sphingobium sp. HBC34]MDO7835468.1 DUF2520 domain-containing protein [Sphingobium sp. HBC34]